MAKRKPIEHQPITGSGALSKNTKDRWIDCKFFVLDRERGSSCVGLRGRSSEREGLISDLIRIAIVKYRFMEAVVEKQGEGFRPRERGKGGGPPHS